MPTAMIHQTDLFHPHEDPDDHFDLACVYALAQAGDVDLKAVLIDHPPKGHPGTPDATGIAQLNFITGLHVPFSVGSSQLLRSRNDKQEYGSRTDGNGVRMVIDILEKSPEPVVINIVGSCRDIAIAGNREPELFTQKCKGIYLNAGSGTQQPELIGELEYNVRLNSAAYAGIFDIPCPVYWMPCFEITPPDLIVHEFGTWYKFVHNEILPELSAPMQSYFAYMLNRSTDTNWLQYLANPGNEDRLAAFIDLERNMWCTGGFIHAAGKYVTCDGEIRQLNKGLEHPVYTFDPITVQCDDDGVTYWNPTTEQTDRYIFHVRNVKQYAKAMTRAMKSLLLSL